MRRSLSRLALSTGRLWSVLADRLARRAGLQENKGPAIVAHLQILAALQPGHMSGGQPQMACRADPVGHRNDARFSLLKFAVVMREDECRNDGSQPIDFQTAFGVGERGCQGASASLQTGEALERICYPCRCSHESRQRTTCAIRKSIYITLSSGNT